MAWTSWLVSLSLARRSYNRLSVQIMQGACLDKKPREAERRQANENSREQQVNETPSRHCYVNVLVEGGGSGELASAVLVPLLVFALSNASLV